MSRYSGYDWLDFIYSLILLVSIIGGLLYGANVYNKKVELEKEIIKQSEEYVIFNKCTKIQGKYYCK